MFTLVKEPAHWWPMRWDAPADGGTVQQHAIELRFAMLGEEEYRQLFLFDPATLNGPDGAGDPARTRAHNLKLFTRVVRGWRGIVDEHCSPLPFDTATIGAFLDVANVPNAFGVAYARFFRAIPETVAGNSEPSPGGGQATAAQAPTGATKVTPTRSRGGSASGGRAKHT